VTTVTGPRRLRAGTADERGRTRRRPLAQLAWTLLAAAIVGLEIDRHPGVPPRAYIVAGGALLAGAYLARRSPRWALGALLGGTLLGLYRLSTDLGPVSVRLTDLPYVVLLGWVLVLREREGRRETSRVGQSQMIMLLAVLGISLVPLVASSRAAFIDAFVSWLRFVQTISLVWLIPYAIRSHEHRVLLVRLLAYVIAAKVGWSVIEAAFQERPGRLSGGLGPNVLGLLAAVLVVLSLHAPRWRLWERGLFVALGLLGLFLTRSIGSIAALGIAFGIFGLRPPTRFSRERWLAASARMLLLVVGVIGAVYALRPGNVPGAQRFESSSTSIRLDLIRTGLEIFTQHPILGVGWQRSSSPEVLGDPQLRQAMGESDLGADGGPALEEGSTTTVHNAYVQILAESGVIGFAAFIALLFAATRGIRTVIRRSDAPSAQLARCIMVVLVVCLIRWNDNPLFGAQPETVLAAACLGLLASYPRRSAEAALAPSAQEQMSAPGPSRVPRG
jgi:O-antigen ligase